MSVAKYYPFNAERGRLRLGLSQIPFSEWLQYEEDFTNRIQQKKQLINSEGKRVLCSLENSMDAQEEFLQFLLSHLRKFHTEHFKITNKFIHSSLENLIYSYVDFIENPLELVSYLIGDDICLLKEKDEDYSLVAASVCAPTWWDLQEKMGKPLAEIHSPIANLEEKIGRMVRHFLINLKTDACYQRSNWFLFTQPDYCIFPDSFDFYSDMTAIKLDNIESSLFLRSERQTFLRLKQTNHIVFCIKVYVEPITIVKRHPAIAKDLMIALQTMCDEQKQGLGITFVEKPLNSYLTHVLKTQS